MRRHIPVLLTEVTESLPEYARVALDGTLGHAGHTQHILEWLQRDYPDRYEKITMIGCDVDPTIMAKAQQNLSDHTDKMKYIADSYANAHTHLHEMWYQWVDRAVLDLGINREHIEDAQRWFSLRHDGPLDMRFSQSGMTAYELLQQSSHEQLQERLMIYGDYRDKRAEQIAQHLIKNRTNPQLKTTWWVRDLLWEIKVNDKQLAVVFQVLRIVTNRELEQVELFLERLDQIMNVNGVCAIITYHSIEDRLVKYWFKKRVENGNYQLINKKVIAPHYTEVQRNKAARSAKLRKIIKLA